MSEYPNSVYVLFEVTEHEGSEVIGIYTYKYLANEALTLLESKNKDTAISYYYDTFFLDSMPA